MEKNNTTAVIGSPVESYWSSFHHLYYRKPDKSTIKASESSPTTNPASNNTVNKPVKGILPSLVDPATLGTLDSRILIGAKKKGMVTPEREEAVPLISEFSGNSSIGRLEGIEAGREGLVKNPSSSDSKTTTRVSIWGFSTALSSQWFFSVVGSEHFHTYWWIAKDLCWMQGQLSFSIFFGLCALAWSLLILYHALRTLNWHEMWNFVALFMWLFANYWWMVGEAQELQHPNTETHNTHTLPSARILEAALSLVLIYYLVILPLNLVPLHRSSVVEYDDRQLKPRFSFVFRYFRQYENLHMLFWIFKDLAWVRFNLVIWMTMLVPSVLIAADFIYISATTPNVDNATVDVVHYSVTLLWVLGNSVWAFGDFFIEDYDVPQRMWSHNEDVFKTARWYSSWILFIALWPIILMYVMWAYLTWRKLLPERKMRSYKDGFISRRHHPHHSTNNTTEEYSTTIVDGEERGEKGGGYVYVHRSSDGHQRPDIDTSSAATPRSALMSPQSGDSLHRLMHMLDNNDSYYYSSAGDDTPTPHGAQQKRHSGGGQGGSWWSSVWAMGGNTQTPTSSLSSPHNNNNAIINDGEADPLLLGRSESSTTASTRPNVTTYYEHGNAAPLHIDTSHTSRLPPPHITTPTKNTTKRAPTIVPAHLPPPSTNSSYNSLSSALGSSWGILDRILGDESAVDSRGASPATALRLHEQQQQQQTHPSHNHRPHWDSCEPSPLAVEGGVYFDNTPTTGDYLSNRSNGINTEGAGGVLDGECRVRVRGGSSSSTVGGGGGGGAIKGPHPPTSTAIASTPSKRGEKGHVAATPPAAESQDTSVSTFGAQLYAAVYATDQYLRGALVTGGTESSGSSSSGGGGGVNTNRALRGSPITSAISLSIQRSQQGVGGSAEGDVHSEIIDAATIATTTDSSQYSSALHEPPPPVSPISLYHWYNNSDTTARQSR